MKSVEKASARLNANNVANIEKNVLDNDSVNSIAESVQPYIFVKDRTKLVKIKLSEIMYIEGLKDYVSTYTPTQKVVSLQTLKSLKLQLPEK